MNKPIHPAVAEHAMEENERLRGLLRDVRVLLANSSYRISGTAAFLHSIDAALSQQAEPAPAQDERQQPVVPEGWLIELGFDVLDRPFRFVESKSHTPTIKVILPACEPDDSSSWDLRDEIARRIGSALATRPAQTEQQPVAVPEDFQPLETIRWWISAYTNPENGPSYQGHGMMVQMLCEYEALRIMLSGRAQQWPTAYPHEAMDKLATDRYRVGAAGAGTLHRYAVRAGDGEQELYRGSESDCQNVARKLAGAFLDGGLAFQAMLAAPIAFQSEQTPVGIVDRLSVAAGKTAAHFDIADCPIGTRLYAAPIAQTAPQGKFAMHQRVRKTSGSEWQGRICGTYSTPLTPEGYAVESEAHAGSVQIYPAKALEAVE